MWQEEGEDVSSLFCFFFSFLLPPLLLALASSCPSFLFNLGWKGGLVSRRPFLSRIDDFLISRGPSKRGFFSMHLHNKTGLFFRQLGQEGDRQIECLIGLPLFAIIFSIQIGRAG